MMNRRDIKSLYAISAISGAKQITTCGLVMVAVYRTLKLIMSWGNTALIFSPSLKKSFQDVCFQRSHKSRFLST